VFSWLRMKKPGPRVGDLLHVLEGLEVDHRDQPFVQVRRGHHRAFLAGRILPLPGDARAKVRHARQIEVGDLLAAIEENHLPLGRRARGAENLVVALREEEIVEIVLEQRAARVEEARLEARLPCTG
jgi:hypothetical protein